jgi:hypothetical protein
LICSHVYPVNACLPFHTLQKAEGLDERSSL